ncbi:MAG TPA: bifunctional precorrin-2 dehydrogenase/sirohydrochlorin ferrochelatase [Tepidisphaeraceae bacterium]|jgi:precorrin-2 dehydrogenase/sirohydrochlorin ferrochelatase
MSFAYPIMLDLTRRRAVIVGGGTVAARKARALLDAGCGEVIAVAPAFPGELPAEVKKMIEAYDARHLEGAFLVFAATDDPSVNKRVVSDAEARGILVGRADFDESAPGNFSNPAVYRQGLLVIAISAGGSPTLAAEVRNKLTKKIPAHYATMAETMYSVRPVIRNRIPDPEQRRTIFRDLASPTALAVLDRYGKEAMWEWLTKKYPMLK